MIGWKTILIVLALEASHAICQDVPQDKMSKKCSFNEVYMKEGWIIPGLDGAKRQNRVTWKGNSGFFITQLQPVKAESFVSPDVLCSYDHPGRLEILKRPARVVTLASWDYRGKVFGYAVVYAPGDIERDSRNEMTVESALQFFDIDGSGRFTVMRPPSDSKHVLNPTIIPEWIRRKNEESPVN